MEEFNFIGNEKTIGYLKMIAAGQNPAQAYLLVGPPQVGKTTAASWLAQALLCSGSSESSLFGETKAKPCGQCLACRSVILGSHPDFFRVEAEEGKTQIIIDQIQNLKNSLALNSSWGKRKVVLMLGIDQLNSESGNCLLKTLEEPNGETVFILVADEYKKILPTIISRCQTIRFFPVGKKILSEWLIQQRGLVDENLVCELAGLSGGRPGKLFELLNSLEDQDNYRQTVREWLRVFEGNLADNFKIIEEIFGKQNFVVSQKITQEALEILGVLLRDLFLAKMKVEGLMNYHFLRIELNALAQKLSWKQIMNMSRQLRQAKKHLQTSNANPRLILENLILAM